MLNLTPTEQERLLVFQAAELARRRRSRGLRLNQAEAAALLVDEALEHARDGRSIPEIRELVTGTLTTDDVLPGVAALVPMLVVEGQFLDGTRLITVYDPITPGAHDDASAVDPLGHPGAVQTPPGDIELNAGCDGIELEATNTGDRAIQVSSHYPFAADERRPRLRPCPCRRSSAGHPERDDGAVRAGHRPDGAAGSVPGRRCRHRAPAGRRSGAQRAGGSGRRSVSRLSRQRYAGAVRADHRRRRAAR